MDKTQLDSIAGWFSGRLPDEWFTSGPTVTADDKQIKVIGTLSAPKLANGGSAEVKSGAEAGRISRFREETRPYRILIAREAERRFKLPVQWGAVCGGTTEEFTPGGSGWSEGQGSEEAKRVMIAARRRAIWAWRRRFGHGFFGPRHFGRGWRDPHYASWARPADYQDL